jgi:sugar/nucleoside kinase (ribokinase family)
VRLKADRRGLITGGTWCADHNKVVEFWPAEEMIAEILSDERGGGGAAYNVAIDIKKLDPSLPVETVGIIGDDEDGRLLLAEADVRAINRGQLTVVSGGRTQYTDAYTSRSTGRRTHIHNPGVGALLIPEHFDFERTGARIAHLGLPGVHGRMDSRSGEDANGWVTILKKARSAGLLTNLELVSISAERIRTLVVPCLPYLDLLIVNDFEIGAVGAEPSMAGSETDVAGCLRAAQKTLAEGAMEMVVVHFPLGAIAVARNGEVTYQASLHVPRPQLVGANGAGDAFAAGFLYGFHEHWGVSECLALGHAAAAASLRCVSTTGAVEPWQTCLGLADAWGRRDASSLS